MKICPNLSNPEVAKEFNELKDAIGEKAAYQVWSLNKGNMIDKAPNGESSILFQALENELGGRTKAIQAKSKLYTEPFFKKFGDWTGEFELEDGLKPYSEVQMSLDANGEPLILNYYIYTKINPQPQSANRSKSIGEQMYDAISDIKNQLDIYIKLIKLQYKKDAKKEMTLAQLNKALSDFNKSKLQSILDQYQTTIAKANNMYLKDGVWTSTRPSKSSDVLEYIINSLSPATFEKYRQNRSEKYAIVAPIQNQYSVVNIIRQAFGDGNIETLDKEMTRDYIRMMWDSDLILTGLDIFNTDRKATSEELEQRLVDAVTSENFESRVHNKNIKDYIKTFWTKINDLVKSIFGSKHYTEEQKKDIITAILSAMLWNEELEKTENLLRIYERAESRYEDTLLLTKEDTTAFRSIIEGTKTRLKAANAKRDKNQALINKLKSQIENNELLNEKDLKDEYKLIVQTLKNARNDLELTLVYLRGLDYDNVASWDAVLLNSVLRDLLGFYSGLLENIKALFPGHGETGMSLYNDYLLAQDPDGLDLRAMITDVNNTLVAVADVYKNDVLFEYTKRVLFDYIDTLDQIKDKEEFKKRTEHFLRQDTAYANLAKGELLFGMGSRSKSNVVRIVDSIIEDTNIDISDRTYKKGHEILRKYNKVRPVGSLISPLNYQKRFMALDRHGVPTGYLIDDLNRGLFYIDREDFIRDLNDKYSNKARFGDKAIFVDPETGKITWPDEDETADDSIYNQYNDELDDWLGKHCQRRYTVEYYKKRRRYLSRYALLMQRQVNRDIAILTQKASETYTEDGKTYTYLDTTKLSLRELRRLEALRKEKRDLSSHYIIATDPETGILSVTEKQGDSLKIADEISRWNQFLRDKRKFKPDYDAYRRIQDKVVGPDVWTRLAELKKKAQLNESVQHTQDEINAAKLALKEYDELYSKYKLFVSDNTSYLITLKFRDLMKDQLGYFDDSELDMLTKRRGELVAALKDRDDLCAPNLMKHAGLGINTDRSMWAELKRLDLAIADRKRELLSEDLRHDGLGEIRFKDIAHMAQATVSDTDRLAFLPYLYNQWANAAASNTDLQGVFNDLFTYKDEYGKLRYLNVFTYLEPNGFNVTYTDSEGKELTVKAIEQVLTSNYNTLDDSSIFVNKDYDSSDRHSMQPLYSLYKDLRFNKLSKEEHEFVSDVLQPALDEANNMIPQNRLMGDGRLPLISGGTMSLLGRSRSLRQVWDTLKYTAQDKFGASYMESHPDAYTNVDLPVRPDGSIVNNIPIRYVKPLANRAALTTDVVGSIIAYYNMAVNYDEKSKNVNQLELIRQTLANNALYQHKEDQQGKKVADKLNKMYYGKTTTYGISNENEILNKKKRRTIKTAKTFKKLATFAMLGANFTTQLVGYLDALLTTASDAFGGMYMEGSDFKYGFTHSLMNFIHMIPNMGNPEVNDKLAAAMQFNLLSKSNTEIFGKLDLSKFSRLLNDNITMAGYTLSDYLINGMVVRSFYHSCRLIESPDGKKEFLNKSEAINKLAKFGYTEKDAIKLWRKAKTNLWDAYELKDGSFSLKDEYKNIVTTRTRKLMQKKLHDRTAAYNGVVPLSEQAQLQSNVWGSYLTLMRGFFINTYWERFSTGVDYADLEDNQDVDWKSEYRRDDMGYEDLRTGEFQGAMFKDAARGLAKAVHNIGHVLHLAKDKKEFTRPQKVALRKATFELSVIVLNLLSVLYYFMPNAYSDDYDDKDPVWTVNIFDVDGEDRDLIEVYWDRAPAAMRNWAKWKMLTLSTRLFTERTTPWLPQTVMDIIKSPSTAYSYYDNLGSVADFVKDIATGRINEEVKGNTGYAGMSRGTRDMLRVFSAIPFHNFVKDLHTRGLIATYNYYRNQNVLPFFLPSKTEWLEDQEGGGDNEFGSGDFGSNEFGSGDFGSEF